MIDPNLPEDLVAYLREHSALKYDPSKCEIGESTLIPLWELRVQHFPMETGSLDCYSEDPNYPQTNSYLVPGVDLIGSCTGGYDAVGMLLWLPGEGSYGNWDSSHCIVSKYNNDLTWSEITKTAAHVINAQWTGMDPKSPACDPVVPWPKYPYSQSQTYDPIDDY